MQKMPNLFIRLGAPLLLGAALFGQTAAPGKLAFEVASVKPAGPLDPSKMLQNGNITVNIGMRVDKAMVSINSLSLGDLIRSAYKIKSYQLSGPSWINQERYNIQAKIPEGGSEKDVPEMLQTLLAERFNLVIRRESKEQSVLALVVAKSGHKMKDAPPDAPPPPAEAPKPEEPKPGKGETVFASGGTTVRMAGNFQAGGATISGTPTGAVMMKMNPNGNMRMELEKATMTMFADMLARFVDRPVIDMTGLTGKYQVAIELAMDDMRSMARSSGAVMIASSGHAGPPSSDTPSDPSGGSIFQSVQQLGLKLEPRKAPIDLLVVEKADKAPTEN